MNFYVVLYRTQINLLQSIPTIEASGKWRNTENAEPRTTNEYDELVSRTRKANGQQWLSNALALPFVTNLIQQPQRR